MDIIEFNRRDLLIGPSLPLGIGRSAICFLTPNMDVIKLYKHNYLGKKLMNDENFKLKLKRIGMLSNETFIVPTGMLFTDDKFVGYTYPYCGAPTMAHLDDDTSLTRLFVNYDKLLEDTKKISDGKLRIHDPHNNNMLFDGTYYMIDLDHCEFEDNRTKEDIYHDNANKMLKSIIKHVYGINSSYSIEFEDKDINLIFHHMNKSNLKEIEELKRIIADKCGVANPTIKKIKQKVKARGVDYGYKGKNEE